MVRDLISACYAIDKLINHENLRLSFKAAQPAWIAKIERTLVENSYNFTARTFPEQTNIPGPSHIYHLIHEDTNKSH